jgi:hypothetical protein
MDNGSPRESPHSVPEQQAMEVDDQPKPLAAVFDWDDTLCPTSWLHRRGLLAARGMLGPSAMTDACSAQRAELSSEERDKLARLEDHVLALLQHAAGFGPVFIITAARVNWVVASAFHFLPRVHALLAAVHPAGRLQVVSAREWYQQHISQSLIQSRPGSGQPLLGDPLAWKTATFEALCAHLQVQDVARRRGQRTDLVSVGDATYEREACARMELRGPAFVRSKTLKLVDRPTLDELLDQLAVTLTLFGNMCRHDTSLHLQVTRNAPPHGPNTPPLQLSQISLGLNLSNASGAAHVGHMNRVSARAERSPIDSAAPLVSPVPSGGS